MNDLSQEVFEAVSEAVAKDFPDITIRVNQFRARPRLPALLMTFDLPSETPGTRDSSGEAWSRCRLTCEAYSSTSLGEARAIIAAADEVLGAMCFSRSEYATVPDADEQIRRVRCVWRASFGRHHDVAAW
nr:hypothetical protein [uncultured Olsenella sp.]